MILWADGHAGKIAARARNGSLAVAFAPWGDAVQQSAGTSFLGAREEFRAKALACAESAERASDPAERLQLLEMAEAWINLAEQAGRLRDAAAARQDKHRR